MLENASILTYLLASTPNKSIKWNQHFQSFENKLTDTIHSYNLKASDALKFTVINKTPCNEKCTSH